MAKGKSQFVCLNCDAVFTKWAGRCPNCQEWNTLTESTSSSIGATSSNSLPAEMVGVADLPKQKVERLITSLEEFDRVLGGDDPGVVRGSVVLLSGHPGVGKSTLLLQVAAKINRSLYFSAEESLQQLTMRTQRLGINSKSLLISAERDINRIIAAIAKEKPDFVVIDSIQTIYDESVPGTPGSLVQIRENTWRLAQYAKTTDTAILLVGHVTKEGSIAGPKALEHLVDAVLFLEGEKRTGLRILRVDKNRYGPTDEVGIRQLEKTGFQSVEDPGKLFASLVGDDVPGRALSIAIEGSRAFLIEIQALVSKTNYGYPKRTAQGIDPNRLNVLVAVLENRLDLPLYNYDIYINVVGGFTVKDPGVDVAIVAAIISGLTKKPLSDKLVTMGEIGLLGEIRPASDQAKRKKEVGRLKYQSATQINSVNQLRQLYK
ncbi:MAG: DNA repair protein RadA [Patescibacteria group bacterium]